MKAILHRVADKLTDRTGCLVRLRLIFFLLFLYQLSYCREQTADSTQKEIAFISDTQAPMWAEKLWLKSNNNTLATKLLFNEITNYKPRCLFILSARLAR